MANSGIFASIFGSSRKLETEPLDTAQDQAVDKDLFVAETETTMPIEEPRILERVVETEVPDESLEMSLESSLETFDAAEFSEFSSNPSERRISEQAKRRQKELAEIRSDIGYFDEHLTKNELFAVRARENLKKVKEFIQESELELNSTESLRDEIEEKEQFISRLTEDKEELQRRMIEQDAQLIAEGNRIAEIRTALEETRSAHTELTDKYSSASSEARSLSRIREDLENTNSALNSKLSEARSENHVFNETIERQSRELSEYLDNTSELEKTVFELEKNASRLTSQRDRLSAELAEKTESIAQLKSEVLEFRSSAENLRNELQSKERHAADRLRSREDEIFSLKSEIDTLHSQLSVRTQMFNQAQNEMNSAKAIAKVAKDSASEVESRLVSSNLQREMEQKQLMEANSEISELNSRYKGLLKELEQTKQENETLRRLQKVYEEQTQRAANVQLKPAVSIVSNNTENNTPKGGKSSRH